MTAIIYNWLQILLNCFVDLEGLGSLLQTFCFSHFIYLCLFFNYLCITATFHCFCLSVKAFLSFSFLFFLMANITFKVLHLLWVHEETRGSNCLPHSFKWNSHFSVAWKAQVDKGLIRALECQGLCTMLCNIQNSHVHVAVRELLNTSPYHSCSFSLLIPSTKLPLNLFVFLSAVQKIFTSYEHSWLAVPREGVSVFPR